jgi:four helix bundle protein
MSAVIRYYHEVKAYRTAFNLQQQIYALSRSWPRAEAYSLTARVLRSSRAIGAELAHAWARRPEPAEFMTRLCMVDAEIAETMHWLETAHACGYLTEKQYRMLREECRSLGKMLTAMARACQRIGEAEEAQQHQPAPAEQPRPTSDATLQ